MIGVLGGLRVLEPEDAADPSAGTPLVLERKAREVLTVLALHAPASVTVDEIASVLWDDPPAAAAKSVRAHVSRIRASLREAGQPDAIATVGGGVAYRLVAGTDAQAVQRWRQEARRCVDEPDLVAALLAKARRTWRGAPELPPTLAGQALLAGWTLEHRQLVTDHLRAVAAGTDPSAALGELASVTAVDPLDEPAWVAYVTALHRSMRQAEALDVVARARRALAEVGLDPGPDLVAAQAAVLAGEPALVAGSPLPTTTPRYAGRGDTAYVELTGGEPDLLLLNPALVTVDGLLEEPHVRRAHEELGALGRLVCLDRRGVGLSSPIDPGTPPLDQWVTDVAEVIASAGLTRPVLVANFDTGLVAIEYAARHPDDLAGLVLVNCFPTYRRRPDYPHGLDDDTTRDLIESAVDPARAASLDTATMVAPTLAGDAGFRDWWSRIGRRGGGPATARVVREAGTTLDVRHRLAAVTTPTLVVHRRQCTNVDPGHSRYLAEHLPDARLRLVDGVDGVWFASPADVLTEVAAFINALTG